MQKKIAIALIVLILFSGAYYIFTHAIVSVSHISCIPTPFPEEELVLRISEERGSVQRIRPEQGREIDLQIESLSLFTLKASWAASNSTHVLLSLNRVTGAFRMDTSNNTNVTGSCRS